MGSVFTKNDTKAIKGVAILLMLVHHLWNLSDRTPFLEEYALTGPFPGVTLNGPAWFTVIGRFGKVCVAIFAFLAGYGLYKQHAAGKLSLLNKIKKLYFQYWKVFIIFIPIAFIFFHDQEPINLFSGNYSEFHFLDFFCNFFAVDVEKYNGEWWFVMGFTICCALGCLYISLMEKCGSKYKEMAVVFLINFFMFRLLPMFIFEQPFKYIRNGFVYQMFLKQTGLSAFFTGIVFAKYGLMDRGKQLIMKHNAIVRLVVFLFISLAYVFLRTFNDFAYWDFIAAPCYIVFCLGFCCLTRPVYRVFTFLGEHSENIWLVHSFFCYYYTPFVKIVYGSGNALIALAVLLGLSLLTSFILNGFYHLCDLIFLKLKSGTAAVAS